MKQALEKKVEALEKRIKELEKVIYGIGIYINSYPKRPFGEYASSITSDEDSLFDKAVEIIKQFDLVSTSLLQRRLQIGYARSARILDQLEAKGYVGPENGSKPREVFHDKIKDNK